MKICHLQAEKPAENMYDDMMDGDDDDDNDDDNDSDDSDSSTSLSMCGTEVNLVDELDMFHELDEKTQLMFRVGIRHSSDL